ncbi:UNVERIFIED_CONTAM: hypothetical protein PYX00_011243 [Menopon gallinae]|uniref:Transcription initiation factor TFIID subunit 8 n=1 Tax=Menopon gallinae TaxID=328185 RepID=A0AAW2H6E2_9NEOP
MKWENTDHNEQAKKRKERCSTWGIICVRPSVSRAFRGEPAAMDKAIAVSSGAFDIAKVTWPEHGRSQRRATGASQGDVASRSELACKRRAQLCAVVVQAAQNRRLSLCPGGTESHVLTARRTARGALARALKSSGFDTANQKALEFFAEVFTMYMFRTLGYIKRVATHSQRSKATMVDMVSSFGILEATSYEDVGFETDEAPEAETFYGPISAPVDKFINIYEFMPVFPPLHTFRATLVKENKVRSRARDVKERIEQKNQVAASVFRILKRLKEIPNRANYLY